MLGADVLVPEQRRLPPCVAQHGAQTIGELQGVHNAKQQGGWGRIPEVRRTAYGLPPEPTSQLEAYIGTGPRGSDAPAVTPMFLVQRCSVLLPYCRNSLAC